MAVCDLPCTAILFTVEQKNNQLSNTVFILAFLGKINQYESTILQI